jgi:hypothetical protein
MAMRGGEMSDYPVTFAVDYPDRELNRLTSFFRNRIISRTGRNSNPTPLTAIVTVVPSTPP